MSHVGNELSMTLPEC